VPVLLHALKLSCLCSQVRIETPKRPDFINECNCTLCSKSGARWAYFHPSEVIVVGTTKGYSRKTRKTRRQKSISVQIVVQRHILH
jgi:hypothetical protein